MFSQSTNKRIKEFLDNTKSNTFKTKEDFDSYFDECTTLAYEYVLYYDKKRQGKQRQTVVFRFLIGVTTGLALIFPLITGIFDSFFTIPEANFAEVGNKLLMISGILYGVQSYYGSTNGHIRYAKAQLSLEKTISVFKTRQNQILASASETLTTDDMKNFTDITGEFIIEIFNTINEETNRWAKDLVDDEKKLVAKYLHKKNSN